MIESGGTFLGKAQESLRDARSAYEEGRYNTSANRSYYAVYQAAIHALLVEGIGPPRGTDRWEHDFVHGQFNGQFIHRRHRYPADLRGVLLENLQVRTRADYTTESVTRVAASRALQRAERFVGAIVQSQGNRR